MVVVREEAEAFVRQIFAAYPEVPLREGTEEIFVRYLRELDYDDVAAVIPDLIRSSQRMPTVADIRHRIAEVRLGLPTALEAFHSVFEPEAERHPLTRYVVEILGGFYNVKHSDLPAATRRQFVDFFNELRDEAVRRGKLPRPVLVSMRHSREPEPADQPSVWTAVRKRFDELPSEERTARVREARKALLSRGDINPDWLALPLIEHEAMKTFAEENGWLEEAV